MSKSRWATTSPASSGVPWRRWRKRLCIAFVLVALIIFLFLRDWRSTIIPVIAIPVSIVAGFFIMYVAGFSINVLTLVAIVLSIGLVCDDAIVVLENIYSKIEQGMTPLEAALKGSREIYFAVISTTVALAAVFLPIVFLSGLTGRLFREFGITLAGCVLVSAFVALTLSPMMCRFLLKKHGDTPNFFYRSTEPFFRMITNGYRASLAPFLRWRWLAIPILLASGGLIAWLITGLPRELAPLEDRENVRVNITAPEGASFEYTESWMDKISVWVEENVPEHFRSFSILGGGGGRSEANAAIQNIYLKSPAERKRTQAEIAEQITREMQSFTGVRAIATQPPTIGDRRSGQPLAYVLQAPNFESLVKVLPDFLDEANKSPVLRQVDADLKVNRPEGVISINRKKAAELGISVEEIGRTVEFAYSGRRFGYFLKDGKQYQVIAQMQRQDRNDPGDLKRLFVKTAEGTMVSLDNLVSFTESASPAAVYRFNRAVSATIQGTPAEGKTLGDGIKELDRIAEKVLPENFRTSLAGQSRDFAESSSSLLFAFLLALLIIYLVLAAQFESFRDPFIIILTVPLSVAGALLSLYVTGSNAQRLQRDRHHHAHRHRHQERHPHRRVRQPAERSRPLENRSRAGSLDLAFPPDPDDQPRDDLRHPAHRAVHRLVRRFAPVAGHRRGRRADLLRVSNALRRARGVCDFLAEHGEASGIDAAGRIRSASGV